MRLRDGSFVEDIRLSRLVHFDPDSRKFPVVAGLSTKKPRSYTWRCPVVLDQGNEGSCVGHGIAHELLARPVQADPQKVNHKYAVEKIYWGAQRIDKWLGGSYPGAFPKYEGTSVLYGLKVAQKLGWFDGYEWSFGLDELILGLGYKGPAVLGVEWQDVMCYPDKKGFVWPSKGDKAGGHCILCKGVNITNKTFTLHNSWGSDWGIGGSCFITFAEMQLLLDNDGEAAFPINRHLVEIP